VEVPGLPHDADDLGSGIQDVAKDRRPFRRLSRLARHAERRERGVLEVLLGGEPEELGVARVRPGPAALDVGNAQLIELVQDAQPVIDGVREARPLRSIAECRVVELDSEAHVGIPSTTRSPTSLVVKPISPARIE
jgi:hypothetical protein